MTKLMHSKLTLDGCGRCSRCQSIKPAAQFHKDCTRTSGLTSRCKDCDANRASTKRAEQRRAKRVMVRDLKAVVKKHPALAELIVWTGERLAA